MGGTKAGYMCEPPFRRPLEALLCVPHRTRGRVARQPEKRDAEGSLVSLASMVLLRQATGAAEEVAADAA
jgi:hypothetical protein